MKTPKTSTLLIALFIAAASILIINETGLFSITPITVSADIIKAIYTLAPPTLFILFIIAIHAAVPVLIQIKIVKQELWTVAFIVAIVEIIALKGIGIITLIYTAYKWDKARKSKQREDTTPPEV